MRVLELDPQSACDILRGRSPEYLGVV